MRPNCDLRRASDCSGRSSTHCNRWAVLVLSCLVGVALTGRVSTASPVKHSSSSGGQSEYPTTAFSQDSTSEFQDNGPPQCTSNLDQVTRAQHPESQARLCCALQSLSTPFCQYSVMMLPSSSHLHTYLIVGLCFLQAEGASQRHLLAAKAAPVIKLSSVLQHIPKRSFLQVQVNSCQLQQYCVE